MKSVEDFLRLILGGIEDVPVVDGIVRHQPQTPLIVPLPEHHILRHDRGLELLLRREVEYLDRPRLRLEGDDVLVPVHDGTVRVDGALNDLIIVFQVNDDDLRLLIFVELLSNANVMIRF